MKMAMTFSFGSMKKCVLYAPLQPKLPRRVRQQVADHDRPLRLDDAPRLWRGRGKRGRRWGKTLGINASR
jgi:hypothetical protein